MIPSYDGILKTTTYFPDQRTNATGSKIPFPDPTNDAAVISTAKPEPPPPPNNDNDNDNTKIPGTFMNDKLYILGTRLTTSYDKLDNSLFFDMFGHAVGDGSNEGMGLDSVSPPGHQFTYNQATTLDLFCQLPGTSSADDNNMQQIPMEFVPQESIDSNTIKMHLLWRCDLSQHLTRSDLLTKYYNNNNNNNNQYVKVSVFTTDVNDPILTVDIPVDTLTVGRAGPMNKSKSKPSFTETIAQEGPMDIVLCVAGLSKSAQRYLPEFIQHHMNVGVDHFFLGVNLVEDLPYFEKQLSYYIDEGLVVLGTDHVIPELENLISKPEYLDTREMRKMRFYNQCLFHAKGMSEFLAIWDVDELWMPPKASYTTNSDNTPQDTTISERKFAKHLIEDEFWRGSPYQQAMSLPEAARSLQGADGCTDWCFQAFTSYDIHPKKARNQEQESMTTEQLEWQGFHYGGSPVRGSELNPSLQKPIIRTKYAHQASFHLGGSCRRSTKPITDSHDADFSKYKYWAQFDECPRVDEPNVFLGAMHHFWELFRLPRHDELEEIPADNPSIDEYTSYMRPTTLKQLKALANNGKIQLPQMAWQSGRLAPLQ